MAVGIAGTLSGLVHGLEVQIAEEVDFANEARSLRWFGSVLQQIQVDRLVVPSVFDDFCGAGVITMELLDGVPVDDAAAIAALGVDPTPLLHECIRVWFATTLCAGAFHGDVHAGNVLVRADGTLALLDWGIVGRLDDATARFFRRMLEGVLGDDSAWPEVAAHVKATYGAGMLDALGIDDEQFTSSCRCRSNRSSRCRSARSTSARCSSAMAPPTASVRANAAAPSRCANWWAERKRQQALMDLEGYGGGFDQAQFLLSKQLVYFERYGKQFLPDSPLLSDPAVFRALLDAPAIA